MYGDTDDHLVEPIKAIFIVEPLLGGLCEIALHSDHDGLGRIADNTSNTTGFSDPLVSYNIGNASTNPYYRLKLVAMPQGSYQERRFSCFRRKPRTGRDCRTSDVVGSQRYRQRGL